MLERSPPALEPDMLAPSQQATSGTPTNRVAPRSARVDRDQLHQLFVADRFISAIGSDDRPRLSGVVRVVGWW